MCLEPRGLTGLTLLANELCSELKSSRWSLSPPLVWRKVRSDLIIINCSPRNNQHDSLGKVMTECRIANMTVLFVANMMMWSAVSPSAGPATTPGRDRETERVLSSPLLLLTSLSSAELSATDRRHSGLRAVSLLSTHSNSIIHKKSLRFCGKLKWPIFACIP